MDGRLLSWDGCLNVRDLGGHRVAAGGATRYRRVVRADCVRQLTDDGWDALVGYGIQTVVDLRLPSAGGSSARQAEWDEIHAIGAAAGVERQSIADDYALSGTMLAQMLADWVDEAPDEPERARRARLSATPATAMLGVLAELDARHCGSRRFLLGAGAANADLDRAAVRLLD